MTVLLVLFWGSAGVILYTLLLFPLWVACRAVLRPRHYLTGELAPPLSVIIAAYNEQDFIGQRIENLLACDYPAENLEILVASDGSTDATAAIVSQFAPHSVRLLNLPRGGKFKALNAAVAAASGELLVFTDANTEFTPTTLRELVRPFADPSIGGVAGNQIYLRGDAASLTADGECAYWNLDTRLKEFQSRAGNAISATGAGYAIRRALFQEIPNGVTDDFFVSTGVIQQGYRLVFAPDAQALEPVTEKGGVEFGRKTRVMTRGLRAVWQRRSLLNPLRHGFYAVQLLTHKILRRLLVFPTLAILVSSTFLWHYGWVYRVVAGGLGAMLIGALVGWLLHNRPVGQHRLVTLPYFLCVISVASLIAVFNTFAGRTYGRWEPKRSAVRST